MLTRDNRSLVTFSAKSSCTTGVRGTRTLTPAARHTTPARRVAAISAPGTGAVTRLIRRRNVTVRGAIGALFIGTSSRISTSVVTLVVHNSRRLGRIGTRGLPRILSPLRVTSRTRLHSLVNTNTNSLNPINLRLPFVISHSITMVDSFNANTGVSNGRFFNIG